MLTQLQLKKVAAIVGVFVGDAAAQPMHWIYKDDVLQSLCNDREDIEFMEPSPNPYYRLEKGRNTCYGDQAYVVLKSLVASGGLNIEHLTQATYDFFGPQSEYENPNPDLEPIYPINRPYRHGCLKEFLKNFQENKNPTGAEDEQIDCIIRIIPLVALYAGHPALLEKVESGLSVVQKSDECVATGLAAASSTAFVDSSVAVSNSTVSSTSLKKLALLLRPLCLPQAFQSALHGLITATSYVEGIRTTMKVGGCNVSRSGYIGACLAAKNGIETIPADWKTKTKRFDEVLELAQQLVQMQI